jgi:N-acetylmuramoyl-L-alanine amidase
MATRDASLNPRPPLLTIVTIAFLGVLAVAVSSQTAPPPSLALLARDGRRALPITLVNDQDFVALDDLAAAFQLTVREEAQGALTVSYKGKTIVIAADQALASVSGRLISLPAAPTRTGRRWLVPVDFIGRALALVYDTRLDLRKPSRLLVIGDLRVPRIIVRYETIGSGGRLTIDATPRASSAITQDNDRLTIKFDADAVDVPNPPLAAQGPQSLVQAVRVVDATTLIVELGPRFAGFKSTSQSVDASARWTIDLAAAQTEMAPAPVAPAPALTEDSPRLGAAAPTFRTIAIDPGHGGDDEGAKGGSGAREKDLTLAVARRVKSVLEARLGIRVLLTRDDDRAVALDSRTALANNNKADLYISLHANASRRATASGATVYYAQFDKTTVQSAVPDGSERVPSFGSSREIELVLWDLAQTRHAEQSAAFADILEQQLHDRIPLVERPVDRAPLRVLESANMPAVLVEMGFLTNAEQEKLLTGDAFQTTFVQAIFDAVVRFRDSLAAGGAR